MNVVNEPSKMLHLSVGGGSWKGSPTNNNFIFLCLTISTIASKNLFPIIDASSRISIDSNGISHIPTLLRVCFPHLVTLGRN